MKISKIKLFVAMLCGGVGMQSFASDMGVSKEMPINFRNRVEPKTIIGRVYAGMSYAELDGQLRSLFSLPSHGRLRVVTSEDQRSVIILSKDSDKVLSKDDFGGMIDCSVVNFNVLSE